MTTANGTGFKFLHAGDIHLDSPMRGLPSYVGVPVEEVRGATREALKNLVNLAISEEVAFLVIPGDLYDGNWEDMSTGLFFCREMARLDAAGIEVFLTFGNHDAESKLTKKLPLPPNVRAFGSRKAETFFHVPTKTALHGRSYKDRDTWENLAAAYPRRESGHLNIGVLHTALAGGPPNHVPYAPCTVTELAAREYDYWALGHMHDFAIVSQQPHIVFSGNLQGRSIREIGAKGAVLVAVEDGAIAEVRHVPLDVVRWTLVEVDLTGCTSKNDMGTATRVALGETISKLGWTGPLMSRVVMTGETEMHDLLGRSDLTLRDDIRALAAQFGDHVWIEKIVIDTSPLRARAGTVASEVDEMVMLFDAGLNDPALKASLDNELTEFANKIPDALFDNSSILQAIRAKSFDEILRRASNALATRTSSGAGQ
jgi:DNA repair exonuclease SbcCD nuclease subunit